jgi:hypothetical protein
VAKLAVALLVVLSLGVMVVRAQVDPQEITHSGFLDANETSLAYEVDVQAGQSMLITAQATTGSLDTFLTLVAPDGHNLLGNDDSNPTEIDSALGYTALEAGTYTIIVGQSDFRYDDNEGYFNLRIVIGGSDVLEPLANMTLYPLSGAQQTLESEHFVLHYTTRGEDATTEDYARAVLTTFEEVWQIQVNEMRWPAPPPDSLAAGDGRYDVSIGDLISDYRNALGFTSPRVLVGDNPHSALLETRASTSVIVIENDFAEVVEYDPNADPVTLMRSTVAHEFHHAIQLGYDYHDEHRWYYEATAVYMEAATLIKEQDAAEFVGYNFDYPEVCFGTAVTDPGVGLLMYGDWLFIQSLVDAHGEEIVQKIWQNIAQYDGFEALNQSLARYDEDVADAVARYRVQNLLRDYTLAETFDATVWLENIIDDTGRWTYTGAGIQELSANYFELELRSGVYELTLSRDTDDLELYAITVDGNEATVVPLGGGGNVEVERENYTYIMVFNTDYDDDVNDCTYQDYYINVSRVNGEATTSEVTLWDATNFEPLNMRRN